MCQAGRFHIHRNTAYKHSRCVAIRPNGYKTRLYSGDVGIALKNHDGQLRVRVWFEGDNGVRAFLPSALPAHHTVYAMAIRKSQGSEFDAVTLVLPDYDVPVLTRELFYTGLTRGREQLSIYSQRNALEQTVTRGVLRVSGLAERIAQPGEKQSIGVPSSYADRSRDAGVLAQDSQVDRRC